ncbi:nucleotidyltransferase domain-containing protein [Candidatus Peregrinibacteria bacterium]|nr:nucleotidyltransferase domain-containing protein [Candidatus Peregrinibacteria bacterium]
MKKIIEKICDNFVKKYNQDNNILGIMLFGSAARNKYDQYSDVDIYVLLKRKGQFSRRSFISNGIRIDIILDTVKETNRYLQEEKNNLRRITSQMLASGKIIYQKTNMLSNIQSIARKNLTLKTKFTKEEILMHKYSIDDFWGEVQRDIRKKNYLAFGLDSHLLMNNMIELLLKLNREYLRQPNEMTKLLNTLDHKFGRNVENFYKTNKIQTKINILKFLIKYIYKKSHGSLPDKWVLKNVSFAKK